MENFKGTKGEWIDINIELGDWSTSSVGIEKGKSICHMYYEGIDIPNEVRANAKLIAAAPLMLEMLIKIRDNEDLVVGNYYDLDQIISKATE